MTKFLSTIKGKPQEIIRDKKFTYDVSTDMDGYFQGAAYEYYLFSFSPIVLGYEIDYFRLDTPEYYPLPRFRTSYIAGKDGFGLDLHTYLSNYLDYKAIQFVSNIVSPTGDIQTSVRYFAFNHEAKVL